MVTMRKNAIVTDIISLDEAVIAASTEATGSVDWINTEVNNIQGTLTSLERMEMEAWLYTARVQGETIRNSRAREWTAWHQGILQKMSTVKKGLWSLQ